MIIKSHSHNRSLIFEGNSLSNYISPNVLNGHYVPKQTYADLLSYKLKLVSWAESANTQTLMNEDIPDHILPFLRYDDIIVLWEGTNDLRFNVLSGADGFQNVVDYSEIVRPAGAKLVFCTITARDFSLDDADLMDRIDDYNTLARANQSYFDAFCDLAGDPVFDTKADASNATYYDADKLHFTQAGYDKVVELLSPVIETIL